METVARFEKVSFSQFAGNFEETDRTSLYRLYDEIVMPARATEGSAGYDFHLPYSLTLSPRETALIPTGIRARIRQGWVLQIYPRSSLGFKYKLQLDNTVGIIDADYYNADNEGHIMIKVTNNSDRVLYLNKSDAFAQGIFLPFGITEDDEATARRTGGFGSTDSQEKKPAITRQRF